MVKKLYNALLIISILLCVFIPGCSNTIEDGSTNGENKTDNSVYSNDKENTPEDNSESSNIPDNTSKDNDITSQETESPEITEVPESELTETSEPKTGKLSLNQQYSDENRAVKILGLKEYKKLESDKYTDKAKKGKKFLVLFLSIENNTNEEDYINYNYISAEVDGKKIEHTFLVNEPKEYPTIFTHIPAGKKIGGFIVWEVPSGWKRLKFIYDGWKNINNVSMKAELTPKDLSDPVIYNANNFN